MVVRHVASPPLTTSGRCGIVSHDRNSRFDALLTLTSVAMRSPGSRFAWRTIHDSRNGFACPACSAGRRCATCSGTQRARTIGGSSSGSTRSPQSTSISTPWSSPHRARPRRVRGPSGERGRRNGSDAVHARLWSWGVRAPDRPTRRRSCVRGYRSIRSDMILVPLTHTITAPERVAPRAGTSPCTVALLAIRSMRQ